uniref:Ig-like domain-containing protein n=1 Tax=Mola mola TaxID=94237 RepID=A0A3Q3X2F4_MOLML
MARFTATLGVVVLTGFMDLLPAKSCDIYAAVGQNLSLPFVYDRLNISNMLRWTHNSSIVFYRQRGRVSVGKEADISPTGSLLLSSLTFSGAGLYQANVLHRDGTLAKTWSGRLCVMDKVFKPQLTYNCDFKSASVNLICLAAMPQGLLFSWAIDGKTLTSETAQRLSISLAQLRAERNFTCSVANIVSKETSDIVRPTCKSPPPPPKTALCFTSTAVVAALTGGAGLIVLLLIIIAALCCCRRRKKALTTMKDDGSLRILSLHKQELDSFGPVYETMHPNEDSSGPSLEPSPRACYEKVSQPDENRPPQLSIAAEEQRPSPVPKPRTKSPPPFVSSAGM